MDASTDGSLGLALVGLQFNLAAKDGKVTLVHCVASTSDVTQSIACAKIVLGYGGTFCALWGGKSSSLKNQLISSLQDLEKAETRKCRKLVPTPSNTDALLGKLAEAVPCISDPPVELLSVEVKKSKCGTYSIKLDPSCDKPLAARGAEPCELAVPWPCELLRARDEVSNAVCVAPSLCCPGQQGVFAGKDFKSGDVVYEPHGQDWQVCQNAGESLPRQHFELLQPVLDNVGRTTLFRLRATADKAVWPNFNSSACEGSKDRSLGMIGQYFGHTDISDM